MSVCVGKPARRALSILVAALAWRAETASAQTSSLFRQDVPAAATPLTLAQSSWSYQAPEPLKVLKINDIIKVIVDEKSQMSSEADIARRKQAQLNAELKNFVRLNGLTQLKSIDGDPHINGTLQGQFRATGDLETKDALKFQIAARVVDIRPNGHLVLEAHRTIRNNDEQWDQSLSGVVRPEDVLPNNSVLSENVSELQIRKREQGQVRDAYRRGWLYRLFDRYGAF